MLACFGLLFLVGCGGTCNDYADNIWGYPPGCECLTNAYGCGPLDSPTGYGYSASLSPKRLAAGSLPVLNVSLVRESSSCATLRRSVNFRSSVRGTQKTISIYVPSVGSVRLNQRGRLYQGNLTKMVSLFPVCSAAINVSYKPIRTPQSGGSLVVQGTFGCRGSANSCQFKYRGNAS